MPPKKNKKDAKKKDPKKGKGPTPEEIEDERRKAEEVRGWEVVGMGEGRRGGAFEAFFRPGPPLINDDRPRR